MFGLNHKLSDSSLYMIHDMVDTLLQNAEAAFEQIPKDDIEAIKAATSKIGQYKYELQKFEEDITEQRKAFFQFSVEELYYMYGQYDKYIGIEFHKFSDSAKKYGRNIGGIIMYGKNERLELEKIMTSGSIPRTNGLVKLDAGSNYGLSNEQTKELVEVGFISGDIYEILNTNTPLMNSYTQKGKKEIPNTINVTIDPRNTDPCKLVLFNLNLRLKNGGKLIQGEWNQYCGYNLYYSPDIQDDPHLKEKIYDEEGTKKRDVRFYELIAKNVNKDISEEELNEFSELLKKRRLERFEMLKDELRKTDINSLEKFKANHPEIYKEVYKTALMFDDDVLTFSKSSVPVYWDFKTFLHIYLRHCEELQPTGHFKSKTPFAYKQKDIRRILAIAIEKLEGPIEERLSKGLEFRTYGEKALYFNGNYYSMRIESTGRIDSFHPNEYKDEPIKKVAPTS